MAVLFMMGTHRLRHMGEALLSLGLVVCLAVSPLPLLADSKPLKANAMKSHQSKWNPQIIFIIFICTISLSLFVNQSCILQVTVQHFAIHLSATLQNSHPVLFSSYYWLIFEFIIDSCCGCGSPLWPVHWGVFSAMLTFESHLSVVSLSWCTGRGACCGCIPCMVWPWRRQARRLRVGWAGHLLVGWVCSFGHACKKVLGNSRYKYRESCDF